MSLNRGIYILWLMCLLVFNHTYGQPVAMSIQSTGYSPHLYRDEPIAITCTASGDTEVLWVRLVNGTKSNDPSHGCSYLVGVGWDTTGAAVHFPGLIQIQPEDCTTGATAGAQSPPFTLSLEGQVTDAMVGLYLHCLAYLDGSTVLSTDSVNISEIRVVPPGPPTLTISGDELKIAEEKPFTFSCSPSTASPGAQPASEYSHEVLRNGVNVASTGDYTPVQADREGFIVRCTDNVHEGLKDKYGEKVVKEKKVYPHYIAYVDGSDSSIDLSLNPNVVNQLTCNVKGHPISYFWSCPYNCEISKAGVVTIPTTPEAAGTTVTVSCSGQVVGLPVKNTTWTIKWDEDIPSSGDTTSAVGPIIGAVFAGLLIVIISVSVAVYVVRYRSGQTEASATGQADGKVTTDNTRASAPPGGTGTA